MLTRLLPTAALCSVTCGLIREATVTNAAARKRHPDPGRDDDVMNERLTIAPRSRGASPRTEDTCRVGIMRRIAAARLRHCGLETMTGDVMLIVSELLTNALLHSGTTEISLKLTVEEGFLRIAVSDGVPSGIAPVRASEEAESGRGLVLVAALAHENGGAFGVSDGGATAWCTLALGPKERS
jgi:hypothetical protein